jgi:tRNA (uracil-5-)-methyltransferase TRM9
VRRVPGIPVVETQLVNQLIALNRAFYARFAVAFSETRSSAQPALNTIVTYISDGVKVLDVGCGNGRLARRLDQAGLSVAYLGVDFSPELIELAAARSAHLRCVMATFRVADITRPNWHKDLPSAPFDAALMLAVLHHVPSFDLRRDVLRGVHTLLRPGGALIMTNWQFTNSEQLRKKIVAWQTVGLDERDLEPGDALLDWKRGGTGYRYCHLLTESEVQRLAAQSGFEVIEQFSADADLNLYSVLRQTGRVTS